ncbi:MAG: LysM peptidoglycan-binding domain-containing protein [Chloroflexi bacterium]|nr:LysM peptidoglycan-binding domain-containing protein [Chloroflexota bacterium]
MRLKFPKMLVWLGLLGLWGVLWACNFPQPQGQPLPQGGHQVALPPVAGQPTPSPTPLPVRPEYKPGTLVSYTAQTGDTLPALAAHFNTTVSEIRAANPDLPEDITTLPPGMPMQIPIYYAPFWGSPFKILPDPLYVNGPAAKGFDVQAFVAQYPNGWLANYQEYAAGATRSGANIVETIARAYSIDPRLLVTLLEYQAGALSKPTLPEDQMRYPLGYEDPGHRGLYLQLGYAANLLNNGYYGWRIGALSVFTLQDGTEVRPDPWQNAASVALQFYFAKMLPADMYYMAISPEGFYRLYSFLFGDPWENPPPPHIPANLHQPPMRLPFSKGEVWAFTGAPHTGWGVGQPFAALDFAPLGATGCKPSDRWAVAVADGVVARSEYATVMLDLDDDMDERTGWNVLYFHLADNGRVPQGALLKAGDPVGHPSCEGGRTTGTHVHIARKYNGEWIVAYGPIPFNLDGWIPETAGRAYKGDLRRGTGLVIASGQGAPESHIRAEH